MTNPLKDRGPQSRTERKIDNYEKFVFNTMHDIQLLMERLGVTRSDLARRLGKNKAFVSRVLGGERNVTLRTLADIAFYLDRTPSFELTPKPTPTSVPENQRIYIDPSTGVRTSSATGATPWSING